MKEITITIIKKIPESHEDCTNISCDECHYDENPVECDKYLNTRP